MPVKSNFSITMTFQDTRGFKAFTRVTAYQPNLDGSAEVLDDIYTDVNGIATATAALSNAKLVRVSFGYVYDIAQEPTSESGQYQLVTQKAHLEGGDGAGGFMSADIPAPKDTIFLATASENLTVIDPADSLITAWQATFGDLGTPRGGVPFSQFFGGQYVGGKPRVRRVLQGA